MKVATYPLCVQIGRDPNFQGTLALQDPGVAELLRRAPAKVIGFSSIQDVFHFLLVPLFFCHLNDYFSRSRDCQLINEVCMDLMDI